MAMTARMRWPLALGTAALLGACTHGRQEMQPQPRLEALDDLLVFANPAECEPGEPLKQLYDTMASYDQRDEPHPRQPVVPPRFANAIGAPMVISRAADHATISMALRGRWLGLPVRAVEGVYGIESDYFGMAIVFDAPVSRTQPVLESHGFHPKPAEALISVPPEETPFGRVEITGDEQTSRLVCDWGL
ncbi:hypothetical protein [Pedomonas mirosovicensis]|uniref:hypothetical protein n=1 Tax=Pedomonas mirosovicensis TaxID=2908641 RepID=UPI0021678A8F|nr:hypothetical protein [Pedomonas mirosovicensis]MCH8685032.1 hypothetical protein [Pedomonas mirosovicensis]